MEETIHPADFNDEFRQCPACGYLDGFHTMLKKENDRVKWLFICPACHKIFDIGYRVDNFKS